MNNERVWRASVVLPRETEEAIIRLRQRDEFARSSLSDILRMLIEIGLEQNGQVVNQSESA